MHNSTISKTDLLICKCHCLFLTQNEKCWIISHDYCYYSDYYYCWCLFYRPVFPEVTPGSTQFFQRRTFGYCWYASFTGQMSFLRPRFNRVKALKEFLYHICFDNAFHMSDILVVFDADDTQEFVGNER